LRHASVGGGRRADVADLRLVTGRTRCVNTERPNPYSRAVERETGRGRPDQLFLVASSYNDGAKLYNGRMTATSQLMTVSRNGQVSIPAEVRARWNTRRVIVVDLGDRVVMRPLPDRPIDDLEGKYKEQGPSSERARRDARRDDAARSRAR
jgi:AbrB family looped-hinge helix DNA binding protein